MKKLLLIVLFCVSLISCNTFNTEPKIAKILAEHFNNKLYKKFDTTLYAIVFDKKLEELRSDLSNPNLTKAFYLSHQNEPVFTNRFFVNGGLDSLITYLENSNADGFNPKIFKKDELISLLNTLNKNNFKDISEFYPVLASLEIQTADALLRYSNYMKYGIINPKKIYNRFYINLNRPDSLKMDSVLNNTDIIAVLKSVKTTSKSYLALRSQLAHYRDSIGNDDNEAIKKIKINLERLRWKIPYNSQEVVMVNIPDFSLTWFKKDDTLAHMKVCVGEKREDTYAQRMKLFLKTGNLDDMPRNHETPQLVSTFNSIQVNPVWNIPVSIAKSEIYWMARKDPYYLSNSNIKVYYKDKQIYEPDTIQWSKYSRERLPFTFKQGSGGGNALGKFKFIFNNSSSIYLHDTNNKYGFKLNNRAISHGCVRIEKPLEFASLMVNDNYQYDQLRMEVNLPPLDTNRNKLYKKVQAKRADTVKAFQLKSSWFSTRKNVAVIIGYYTAWAENGKVEFRPDVYEYDEILWTAIKKYM